MLTAPRLHNWTGSSLQLLIYKSWQWYQFLLPVLFWVAMKLRAPAVIHVRTTIHFDRIRARIASKSLLQKWSIFCPLPLPFSFCPLFSSSPHLGSSTRLSSLQKLLVSSMKLLRYEQGGIPLGTSCQNSWVGCRIPLRCRFASFWQLSSSSQHWNDRYLYRNLINFDTALYRTFYKTVES